MTIKKSSAALPERAQAALARYEEAVERQRVEEAQWHALDRRRAEVTEIFCQTTDARKSSALIVELNRLFEQRNVHGLACNNAIAEATRAHREIIDILCEAGFDREWLLENPAPSGSIH